MAHPTLDQIISGLESKIREGNFYNLYHLVGGEEILVASEVNELFIKDYVSTHSFQKENLLCIIIQFCALRKTNLVCDHIRFRFTMDFPTFNLQHRYYRCATVSQIVSVSGKIGDCFDKMWIKEMGSIHDILSKDHARDLNELSMLKNLRLDTTSQVSSLAPDLLQYIIGPMLFFHRP